MSKMAEIQPPNGDERFILECVSKCREMQFRGHQVAFQGEKPQAYWLQVKVFQHRNAA
jgi:hypothetical protein